MINEISAKRLADCHPDLIRLFSEAAKHRDFIVTCGYRDHAAQEKAFAEGKSKVHYPEGKHNKIPSLAVDFVPIKGGQAMWTKEYVLPLAGFIMGLAAALGVSVTWGGDWDGDFDYDDQKLRDYVHIELK